MESSNWGGLTVELISKIKFETVQSKLLSGFFQFVEYSNFKLIHKINWKVQSFIVSKGIY